jgi:DUF1009 family protein
MANGVAEPLGILAGAGPLPAQLARTAIAMGRPVFVVLLEGFGDPAAFPGLPQAIERIGAAGRIRDHLRAHGIRQIVMAGRVSRPSLVGIRPDAYAAKLLGRIGRSVFAGDDGFLSALARVFGEEGFEVVPVQSLLRDILAPEGLLAGPAPGPAGRADILRGVAVARALGGVDVGQCCVVQQGLVLGVEAIEGTDALIARCGALKREGPAPVLVKLPKPGQDRRVDLPTIGPGTVAAAVAAGLAGLAVGAGGTSIVDRVATLAAAEAAGMFVLAFDPDRYTA